MSHVAVVSDSVCSIPQNLMDSLDIKMVPVRFMLGDKEYRDIIDITGDVFFRRMREEGLLPTTSASPMGEFLQIFQELRGKVDGVVAFAIPPELPSGCYDAAKRAAALVPDMKIEVVDSRWTILAHGFVVLAGARAAAQGADVATVARVARETSSKMNLLFTPGPLKYFRRLGRFLLPGTEEDWAKLCPILTMKGGRIALEESCSSERGIPRMIELVKERVKKNSPLHLGVFHAGDPAKAEEIKKEILADVRCDELVENSMTPVSGIHTGPGTVGVAFYNE